jgi:Outer membrane protein beta-barrel domain
LPINLSRSLLILFFFFASEYSFSQSWQFGIKGGLSLPNLTSSGGSEISQGYKTISGPDFAVVADYRLSEKFSIETGLEFSTQGGQKSGLQAIPPLPALAPYFPPGTQYLYANFTSSVRLQYLMFPVLLKYTLNLGSMDHWKLYVDGGFFGALLLSAKASASGTSKIYYDMEETQPVSPYTVQYDSTGDIKDQLHNGNFGIEGNLGLLYQMNATAFFMEGGGNYGFINLQKDNQNGVNYTGALIFRIGLFVSLARNKRHY